MKLLNYLVFVLYTHYKKREPNHSENYFIAMTSLGVTFVTMFNIYSLYLLLVKFNITPNIPNKYIALFCGFCIFLLNYLYINSKKFLNYDFKFEKRSYVYLFLYLIVSILIFVGITKISQ
jgi:cellulose synthase/poly-beta-1,6-N-acetylglucosamine synthase-like glycosyltransferase